MGDTLHSNQYDPHDGIIDELIVSSKTIYFLPVILLKHNSYFQTE